MSPRFVPALLVLCSVSACGSSERPPAAAPADPPRVVASSPAPAAPPAASSAALPVRPALPVDKADAKPPADLARSACASHEPAGCDALVEYWGAREIVPPTKADAFKSDAKLLKEACDQHSVATACVGYAMLLGYGTATGQREPGRSGDYYDRASRLGDLHGFRSGNSEKGAAALERATAECDAGRARACSQVGWAAKNGLQRTRNKKDAFAAYRKSCQLGSALGCRWAGMLARTEAEVMDLAESERLLTRGCDADFPAACDELGLLVKSVRDDATRALALQEKSCAEGGASGCAHAGAALIASKERDTRARGLEQLRLACETEDEEACQIRGELLEKGADGVKKDRAAAFVAYVRSCAGEQQRGCEGAARVAGLTKTKGLQCQFDRAAKLNPEAAGQLRDACRKKAHPACLPILACDQ